MSSFRRPIKKNIIGLKFGHLVVTGFTDQRTRKKGIIYTCQCDCGNIRLVTADSLKRKKVTRCMSCSKRLKSENISNEETKKKLDNLIVENTKISLISKDRSNSNNTSGYKGVVFDKQRKKWRAQLVFQKKCHNLGRYDHIEDAIKARFEAEKNIFQPFIDK